jgi:signal transduction histidine kinase
MERRIAQLPVGRSLAVTIGVLLALAAAGIGLALIANAHLTERREFLLDRVGPSLRNSIALEGALVNEETGVRGYVISGEPSFLEPYRDGLAAEAESYREIKTREHATGPRIAADAQAVRASAQSWRGRYVMPTLRRTAAHQGVSLKASVRGKAMFNQIRSNLARLQSDLTSKDTATRNQLNHASNELQLILILAGLLILGSVLLAGLFLRRLITRPLARLGSEAGRVAAGEFSRPLAIATGPREITELGLEIDAMRERIVQELSRVQASSAKLAGRSEELRRSNAELEQFAYVASHDLQEPLRKVASFCQALKSRYHGRLDERADQYIDFAVDGAQRMQVLIDALLALSRVGRGDEPREQLALDRIAAAATSSLSAEIQAAGARVLIEELPEVRGERTLLVSVFQNLIGNSIKFAGARAPVIRIGCERRENEWLLSFADNGIGIEAEYGERIFQIFQRLHTRDAYEGTGIGLALCRKIAEYHGGRIWLDPEYTGGARFQLTLPMAELSIAKETGR